MFEVKYSPKAGYINKVNNRYAITFSDAPKISQTIGWGNVLWTTSQHQNYIENV